MEISSEAAYAQATAEQKAKTIEETLSHFGIPAKVIDTKAGPTITQFAVEPGFIERKGLDGTMLRRKVPVNRILALSNDLALALAMESWRRDGATSLRPSLINSSSLGCSYASILAAPAPPASAEVPMVDGRSPV